MCVKAAEAPDQVAIVLNIEHCEHLNRSKYSFVLLLFLSVLTVQPTVMRVTMMRSQQTCRMDWSEDEVRTLSISIAEVMAIIALVAVDCLAIRIDPFWTFPYLILGGLPMQIALVIGLLRMYRRRKRMEKSLPFLIGFEAVGWISLLMYVVICFRAPVAIDQHLVHTLSFLVDRSVTFPLSTGNLIYRGTLAMSYLSAPQLAAALVAGLVSQRCCKLTHVETGMVHE